MLSPEVLSMAGLAGAAPCGTSTGPGWTWSTWYLSREVSLEAVLLQPPSPTAQCQPLCAALLSDVGVAASVLRSIFQCLICSCSFITADEDPQEVKRQLCPLASDVHQPGNCDMWSSEQQHTAAAGKHQETQPQPSLAVRRGSAAEGCGDM